MKRFGRATPLLIPPPERGSFQPSHRRGFARAVTVRRRRARRHHNGTFAIVQNAIHVAMITSPLKIPAFPFSGSSVLTGWPLFADEAVRSHGWETADRRCACVEHIGGHGPVGRTAIVIQRYAPSA
jgi:hypothetical protein